MSNFSTEQEKFWSGPFGVEYSERNSDDALLKSNKTFFSRCLKDIGIPKSCLELGANIGMNLRAINEIFPETSLGAVEINRQACDTLKKALPDVFVKNSSITNYEPEKKWGLVLIKGVLIHINPELLPKAYRAIDEAAERYVLIAEYYNPTPVEVKYRGFNDKLFKRDFAGEFLSIYPNYRLKDYGFVYHLDRECPLDDVNWFLLEKN